MKRTIAFVLLGIVVVTVALSLATLAPRRAAVDTGTFAASGARVTVRGAYHVHSTRSDGSGGLDDIARAAFSAGLDFVIVTDHGDGTRVPGPPAYRAGVLVIDGVEVSANGGHYVAIGLAGPVPYALGGDAASVVEDVTRLGGFGIVAHPDSPKRALRWTAWEAPVDAFEWLNTDSEWRDESRWQLTGSLLHYPWRPVETVAALFSRPVATLARWDAESRKGRALIALGAVDAHARLGPRGADDDEGEAAWWRPLLALPSYGTMFRTITLRVPLERRYGADAMADARATLDAIRAGRVYTVVDGLGRGGALDFVGDTPAGVVAMGARLSSLEASGLRVRARTVAPPGSQLVILRSGEVVASTLGVELDYTPAAAEIASGPNAYRVEVRVPGAPGNPPVPWIVGNPIFVGVAGAGRSSHPAAAGTSGTRDLSAGRDGWREEHDIASRVRMIWPEDATDHTLLAELILGDTDADVWAAVVRALEPTLGTSRRLTFRASATAPMRLSVQFRTPDGDRWRRSVYLEPSPRWFELALDEFSPPGRRGAATDVSAADSLLFVFDRTNAARGARATVKIDSVTLQE